MKPKLSNRVLAALLTLVLLVGLMPGAVFASPSTTSVYVNGVDILTVQDNTVACGEGTAVYDPDTNTLTLNDAHITTAYNLISGIYAEGDLDIVLNGDNTMDGTNTQGGELPYGIYAKGGDISIKGTGTLTLTARAFGIIADNDVSIGADIEKLYVSTATQALRSEKGGVVTIGGEPFTGIDKKITIENGKIASPLYELMVNGVDILTAPNYTVSCGNGKATYDPTSNTLTLDNVQIDYQQYADDNTKGAILFDGDLNIKLIGENNITSVTAGIYSQNRGTLTITGDKLTIDSVYYGIGKVSVDGNLTVDGAELYIHVGKKGNYSGMGFHAGGILSIVNGAYVDATDIVDRPLMGNGGVIISDSTVYAYTVSEDGYGAIASDNDVLISNSTVDAKTNSKYGDVTIWAGNDLTPTTGDIMISDNSKVTINSATGNAAYTPTGNIVISDSEVKATTSGDYPAIVAAYDVTISNGIINASTEGQDYSIWAQRDLLIEGTADVTASGGKGSIGAANSFTIIPPDGKLIDVWMGDSQDDVSRYSGLPLSEETVITEKSLYFHSELHTHTFDIQVVSDDYKASAATCTEPATYYKSCVCGEVGAETFTNGAAKGHSYENGRCTVCDAPAPGFKPVITVGANGTWQKGAEDGLSFTSNAAFADFVKVQVDGKDLAASEYEVEEGSTVVTLKASYLETLSVGKHTLAIVSDTGTATTEFTIQAAPVAEDDTQSPETGDDSNIALWIAVMLAAGTGLTATAIYRRKRYGGTR